MVDYSTHICADHYSPSKLYFVLNLSCKALPDVDPSEITLQAFKVSKDDILYVVSTEAWTVPNQLSSEFQDLSDVGRKQARKRSLDLVGVLTNVFRRVGRSSPSTDRALSSHVRILRIECQI